MSALRKLARGRDCQVRIPGVCNFDPDTTVLAHYRLAGLCGMGLKSHDLFGAWACSSCHDEIDRRTRTCDVDFVSLAHLEGVMRTLAVLISEGRVSV